MNSFDHQDDLDWNKCNYSKDFGDNNEESLPFNESIEEIVPEESHDKSLPF